LGAIPLMTPAEACLGESLSGEAEIRE
jgi:hypothetical protein